LPSNIGISNPGKPYIHPIKISRKRKNITPYTGTTKKITNMLYFYAVSLIWQRVQSNKKGNII
jgi:hypothetical protein